MSLRVLGLDPGTATFGWGVVESGGERLVHRAHGVILTEPSLALGDRLAVIRDALVAIIREQRPDRIAIERIFSQGNVQSAVGIGAARGVTLLVAADLALPLIEATPSEMKRAVAGDVRRAIEAAAVAGDVVHRRREVAVGHVFEQDLAGLCVEDAEHALCRAGDDGAVDQQRGRRHADAARAARPLRPQFGTSADGPAEGPLHR